MNDTNKSTFHDISIRIVKIINLILMTMPFAIAWYSSYADKLWVVFYMRGHWLVIGLFAFLYLLIGRIYDAFKISYNSFGEMVYSQMLSCFEVDMVMYIVAWLLIRYLPPVIPMLFVFAAQSLFAVLWSLLARAWYFHTFPASNTIIVSDDPDAIKGLITKYGLERKYNVTKSVSVDQCVSNIDLLNSYHVIFLSGAKSHERNIITKYCLMNNTRCFFVPRIGDLILASAEKAHMFHILLMKLDRADQQLEYRIVKRMMDIALSLIAIFLFSPVMFITAICIKAEDHGPVIYKQCRLTKDGKKFNILKFRSMRTDAESDGVARLSTGENDDMITRVGRFIRKVRIDELPQLFNILAGDISIVGPRAERPELAEEYEKELPEFALRLQVKAGLTGYAQVYGKYNTTPRDKLLMDLMYISNMSISEDIRIIFATIKILFMPESTEGIEKGQINALANSTETNSGKDE